MIIRELITRLGFDIDEAKIRQFNQDIGAAKQLTGELVNNLQDAARQVTQVGKVLTVGLTLPIIGLGAYSVKAAGDMEQLQIAFTTLLGSADKATKFTEELLSFAASTPFEFSELKDFAKLLLAARVEVDQIIPTMSMLGDISALVGMDKLPFMVRALIDVKNKTKLTGEEIRQFVNAGVAVIPLLADVTGKTTAEVSDMVSSGQVSYDLLVKALQRATAEGGQFHAGMSAQVGTLNQVISNLGDAVFKFRVAFGKLLMKELPIKQFVQWLIDKMESLSEWIAKLSPLMRKVVLGFLLLLAAIGPLLMGLGSLLSGLMSLYILGMTLNVLFGSTLVASLLRFGGALLAPIAPFIPMILLAIATIGILWAVIDDFSGWIEGKKSVFGEILGPIEDFDLNTIVLLGKTFDIFFQDIENWLKRILGPWGWFLSLPIQFARKTAGDIGIVGGAVGGAASWAYNTAASGADWMQNNQLYNQYQGPVPAGPSAGGQATSLHVSSTINTVVPDGTSESQKASLQKTATDAVEAAWQGIMRATSSLFPK